MPGIVGSRTRLSCRNRIFAGITIGPDSALAGLRHAALTTSNSRRPTRPPTDKDEKGRRITGVDGKHMPIGDVAARTERSLRTTGHSAEARLVVPSPARTPLRP